MMKQSKLPTTMIPWITQKTVCKSVMRRDPVEMSRRIATITLILSCTLFGVTLYPPLLTGFAATTVPCRRKMSGMFIVVVTVLLNH